MTEIDFKQELYKAFGQVKDFTLGMQIAKRFYEMGIQHQEPVSEDLEAEIDYLSKRYPEVSFAKLSRIAVHIAKWQRKQMIDKACEWLQEEVVNDYGGLIWENLINDFKKYMEG